MKLHERIQFVTLAYAIFAYLWMLASFPLEDITLSLTASPEIGTLTQLLAIFQGYRMLLESMAAHRMLACTPEEQDMYLEIMYRRIT